MSTKYLCYSYLRTDNKEINLTAYSDNDIGINVWNSGYALRKAAEGCVRPGLRNEQIMAMKDGVRKQLD